MVQSKAKLKSNGDRASPRFRPFRIGNASDKCLSIWILLQISLKQILIRLTSFIDIPNSMRMFYNTVITRYTSNRFRKMAVFWVVAPS
jgi:hypothetical protein